MHDGELIAFARTLIEPRGCRDEVGYIDGLPDRFLGGRVVDLARKLNRRIPDSANIYSFDEYRRLWNQTYPMAEWITWHITDVPSSRIL